MKNNINTVAHGLATTNAHNYTINDGVLSFAAGGALSGVISGTGQLQSSGGTLQLAGETANTNTGLTTVSGGQLQLNKPEEVNAVGGDITMTGNGQLSLLVREQVPDTATITLLGTSTDSVLTTAPVFPETVAETVANVVVNSSTSGTGGGQIIMRNGFTVTGTGTVVSGILGVGSGHTATVHAVNITATDTTSAILRIAGNSAASTLNIGAGGITASGGDIQVKFNTNNQDAVLNLGGNFTATGNVNITDANYAGTSLHIINLLGGPRTFDIAEFTITTVSPDIGDGTLVKTGDGTLALNGTLGTTGAFTLNADDGLTTINESQTIAALNIGSGATVVLNQDLTPAPGLDAEAVADAGPGAEAAGFEEIGAASTFGANSQGAAVPEPGSVGLLLVGALGLLARRARTKPVSPAS